MFGIGTHNHLEYLAKKHYQQYNTDYTFNWVNNCVTPLTAIAIQKPVYIFTAGRIRFQANEMSADVETKDSSLMDLNSIIS